MRHAEVAVVQTARHHERRVGGDHFAARALALEQLVGALISPAVHAHHHRDQRLAARARLHRDRHHSSGRATTELLGGDLVGRGRHQRMSRARDLARVGINRDTFRQSRVHSEVEVVGGVGVHLAHLNVLVDDQRRVVGQLGHRDGRRVRRQVQRAQLPVAGRRVARAKVHEAVLVVGLVVLQPDLLVLALQRPRHARHVLDGRPVLQIRIACLDGELTHLVFCLRVVQVDSHGRDPLTAVLVEGHLPVVGVARAVVHGGTVVLVQ